MHVTAFGAWLVLASAALPATRIALADDDAMPSPQDTYQAASERFRAGDYEAALELIESALVAGEAGLPLLRLRGEVLMETRDFEGALAAYEAFLAAGPRGGNLRQARRIVRDLRVVKSTFLQVKVDNGPAQIYLDSRSLGRFCVADPECKEGILPGRYRIFIERDGFEPIVERVEVTLGETTVLERTLVEQPSDVTVAVYPDDAQVAVDGEVLGTGAQEFSLEAGEHEVILSAGDFATESHRIEARRGEPVALEVQLSELVRLEISVADRASALEVGGTELFIDGRPISSEEGLIALARGEAARELTVRAEGFVEASVMIPADRPRGEPIAVVLEPIPKVASTPAPPPAQSWRSRVRPVAATSFGVAGATGVALAGGFAIRARAHWNGSKADCDDDVRCNEEGFARVQAARNAARRADVAVLAGGAAAAAGLAFWLLPDDEIVQSRVYAAAGAGAAGLLSFALAGGFGLEASARWSDSKPHCDVLVRCDEEGVRLVQEARSAARRSNIMIGVGGVATASALALWFYPGSGESPAPATVSAGKSADGSGVGFSLSRRF